MELLAPAGDLRCLEQAIEAGADAVYLGLSLLNARRGARNFTPAELEKATQLCHQANVAVHLTMNIDIARRETGAAARILAMARDMGVDAIIARDWAVIALWQVMRDAEAARGGFCPALHVSTQSAVTCRYGALMARELGAARVILARELTLDEIRGICGVGGIDVEVFAQGALCYSISGRCLMSSWGGGRSGNRGLCTSPCRVPWAVDGEQVGTAMSMRDLVTVDRLGELEAAGVRSIKIEGRLKKPEWVREAVGLYREALGPRTAHAPAKRPDTNTISRARNLAAYAGRDATSGWLDGNYHNLTGMAARKSVRADAQIQDFLDAEPEQEAPEQQRYSLDINVTEKGVSCRCHFLGRSESWRMPKTKVKRESKATSIEELFAYLKGHPFGAAEVSKSWSNEPDFMLPPRNVKSILATLGAFLNRITGHGNDGADAVLKAPLPDEMRAALSAPQTHPANVRRLGDRPSQARVSIKQLNSSLMPILRDTDIILTNAHISDMEFVEKLIDPGEATYALPDVYFPDDAEEIRRLVEYCRDRKIRLEANSWDSVHICRQAGAEFITGPGMPVLNHIAVKCLRDLGAQAVTMSMEADRRQIEDVCAASCLPLHVIVYARPILAYTRIPKGELLNGRPEAEHPDGAWTDRRGISLQPESEDRVTVFRSIQPFNWSSLSNRQIQCAHLTMDLSGESFPLDVWKKFQRPGDKKGFLFNYDRGLK